MQTVTVTVLKFNTVWFDFLGEIFFERELLLDNAPSHPTADEVTGGNNFVMYIPLKALIIFYCCQKFWDLIESIKQITLIHAVTNFVIAWESLETETQKCWNKISLPYYEVDDNISLCEIKK